MTAPVPELASLAPFLGRWRGEGLAEYPTMETPVRYREAILFDHVGDAFLRYEQESWSLDDDAPLHFERGFLRPGRDGEVELMLAHPIGLTEIAHGRFTDGVLSLTTDDGSLGRAHTGDPVAALRRRYRLDGDVLAVELDMALDEVPLALHLRAELRRAR